MFVVYLDRSSTSDVGVAVLETNLVPGQSAVLTDGDFTQWVAYFVWTTTTSITWTHYRDGAPNDAQFARL